MLFRSYPLLYHKLRLYFQEVLVPFTFVKEKADQLNDLLKEHVGHLTELHVSESVFGC